MNPSKLEIELHFQREKYARETQVRQDVANILESADASQLRAKVAEVVESVKRHAIGTPYRRLKGTPFPEAERRCA